MQWEKTYSDAVTECILELKLLLKRKVADEICSQNS